MEDTGDPSGGSEEPRILRELLARLYDASEKAARLLSDANFDLSRFDVTGTPIQIWFNALDEAQRQAGTWETARDRLLEIAERDYPEAVRRYETTVPGSRTTQRTFSRSRFADAERERLGRELDFALARRRDLDGQGVDTRDVGQEILVLKRQFREGGRLRRGDWLGDGRYLLIDPIGRGGFATVWKARDRVEDRPVAIKVLHAELAGDPVRRDRFLRGARIMRELSHESIVSVLDPDGEDGGFHYFVMELLAGGDLHKRALGRPFTQAEVLEIILRVGGALALAHRRGLVHRDVKPANILLDANGRAMLTDFDLVGGQETTGGTRTGALGTFAYAAPELMERPQDATPAADVYGLAATAIFLLRGKDLSVEFIRSSATIVAALPCAEALKVVLTRAIEVDPGARFSDAEALCAALAKAAATPPPDARGTVGFSALVPREKEREPPSGGAPAPAIRLEPVAGIEWVWVPPGTFLMGSSKMAGAPGFDPEAYDDELPAHRVSITRGFFIGRHPVTNASYASFQSTSSKRPEPALWGDRRFGGAEQPVVSVSWEDASAFCEWLSTKLPAGFSASLPTEAEWEYAARGTDGRRYPWGDEPPTPERAVFGQPYDSGTTAIVGAQPEGASPFGCEGMVGNVWEWCRDAWRERYDDRYDASVDSYHSGAKGFGRVTRGASWHDLSWSLRAATRSKRLPTHRDGQVGLRVVCRGPHDNVDT